MKKLLITGFEPFGGESINPSWEAVKKLPEVIGDKKLIKLQIPTVFGKGFDELTKKADEVKPDIILCIGQAGGRKAVTPEVIGINLREASIPDNEGNQPVNEPVVKGGREAYFATIPVRDIVKAVNEAGLPCSLSYSAGAFVCNDVLYSVLNRFDGIIPAGFIHVPFIKEQVKNNEPYMELDDIVRALSIAIEQL